MLKVCGTNYILRFKEKNEIKTLKFKDFESMSYVVNKLEEEKQNYVIIRYEDLNSNTIKDLTDYVEESE